MSLKDRFNTANAKSSKIVELEKQVLSSSYYASDLEAQNSVSLGVLDTLIDDEDINAILKVFFKAKKIENGFFYLFWHF